MRIRDFYTLFSIVATLVLIGSLTETSFAQNNQWAIKMFGEMGTERSIDFGDVALHANVEHHFQFKNIYNEDVVVSSVSSNCGCTKASATKSYIRPGEIGEIVARLDTSGKEHTKQRKATVRVMFSKPRTAEVQLQVKSYIRPDVGFDPGLIEFGTVPKGTSLVKKAYLQYQGRSDWALTSIQKTNPNIRAEAREVKRNGGSVVYEIQIELKADATPGYISDLLKFQTNEMDRANASLFLPVQGVVLDPLSVKPAHLQLGVVETDDSTSKNLVVSGKRPFKILDVKSNDPRFSFLKSDLESKVHVIPVLFQANAQIGNISGNIVIRTQSFGAEKDIQVLQIPVSGFVVEQISNAKTVEIVNDRHTTNEKTQSPQNADQKNVNRPSENTQGIDSTIPRVQAPAVKTTNNTSMKWQAIKPSTHYASEWQALDSSNINLGWQAQTDEKPLTRATTETTREVMSEGDVVRESWTPCKVVQVSLEQTPSIRVPVK